MSTKEASTQSPIEPQPDSASTLTTPDTANLITPNEFRGDTPTPGKDKPKSEMEGGKPKSKMPPPSLPINVVQPTPPRMSRLPSLQQISSHLHISSSPTNPPTAGGSPGSTHNGEPGEAGRPSLSLATGIPASASPGQGFASSPSGRLKMPVSAMKRTMSQQGNNPLPTPLAESASTNTSFNTTDPLASPTQTTDFAAAPKTPKTVDQAGPVPPPMAKAASKDFIAGYKAVPSLAQITRRHQERSPSIDQGKENVSEVVTSGGESRKLDPPAKLEEIKPKVEEVKNPEIVVGEVGTKTGDGANKKEPHPLAHTWTMYFDSKTYKPPPAENTPGGKALLDNWEASLLKVGDIDTVESFCQHFNNIRLPSRLNKGANYHLFKTGIRPMWEDPANANGGKWVVLLRNAPHLMDFAWANLVMGLVGNTLDPDDAVCGIVASSRPKVDRVQLWTRSRADADAESLNALGQRIMDCMGLDASDQGAMSIEFQYHASDAHPAPGLFFKQTFPPNLKAYPGNVPSTPSRLGASHIPPQPVSPTTRSGSNMMGSRSPRASNLGLPGQGEPMRRIGSGQGMDAFAGPMGGKRNSFSGGMGIKNGAGH